MKIHNVQQGSPEWFALRLGKFTCSDAQSLLANGKGLETLAFTKVAERKTSKAAESYSNEAMDRGREIEELARSAYEIECGQVVDRVGFVEYSDWVGGSPDGFVGKEGAVEFKCPTDRVFVEYLYYKKIKPEYFAQMQMQMYITDRKWCDYAVFNPNFEKQLLVVRVPFDEEIMKKLEIGIGKGVDLAKDILAKI